MTEKQIKECYATIFKEVINAVKEDPMLQANLDQTLIESLEEVATFYAEMEKEFREQRNSQ